MPRITGSSIASASSAKRPPEAACTARCGSRRREPQRAVQAAPGSLFADDADAIEDPVMRGIYKAARTKALA